MAAESALRSANRLRKAGRGNEALAHLRAALRSGSVPAEEMERAGRLVLRELAAGGVLPSPLRVLLVGQCTTSWLAPTLVAVAWGGDAPCVVTEGEYDNVAQSIETLQINGPAEPPLLILLPWHQRLLSAGDRSPEQRIEDELEFWRRVWREAAEKRVARVIQIGYDWITPGAGGYHLSARPGGDIDVIRRVNGALRQQLPPGGYFVSLEDVAGVMGRAQFYDARRYFWTKQPFSEVGTCLLAEHLFAAIRAVTVGPRKLLVVDLDNTLWGGLVGELGPRGIAIGETPDGEAFLAFQQHLKALTKRGVLLAACSKNNLRDAQEPFLTNPNMVLSLDDFAAFEANWEPKSESMLRIASTLSLGLDSFVFFDDSKAEQELVRQSLGEVAVVNAPEDPSEYVRVLQNGLWFETVGVTSEDEQRAAHYTFESHRRAAPSKSGSIEDYLRSLEMVGAVRKVSEADMERIVQLLGKTNQFNLTTRRHGLEQLGDLLSRDGAFGLTLRLRDRFGDYGLVAVALAIPATDARGAAKTLLIDTFLMSCRVIGRTAEHLLMRELLMEARRRGFSKVLAEFVPTSKNELVSRFYEAMEFARVSQPDRHTQAASVLYERSADDRELPATFIHSD